MSFYVFGDIHGRLQVSKVTSYMNRIQYSEDDVIILLGDVGVCWDGSWRDDEVIKELQSIDCLKLFVDGNHECFPLMYSYPEYKWNGGYVHEIREDILHLQRGYVFTIHGVKFFTFGGAHSIDKYSRTEGISWWPEELPCEEEYERAWETLRKNKYEVDYILTHTSPYEVTLELVSDIYEEEEELQRFLQEVADNVTFSYWFFGHHHVDETIDDSFICLYDEVYVINTK